MNILTGRSQEEDEAAELERAAEGGHHRALRALEEHRQLAGVPPPRTRSLSRMLVIGCTGNAGTLEHDSMALDAGQDLIWPKPAPTKAEMRRDICKLLATQL